MRQAQKNTGDYMSLVCGQNWASGINENFPGNEPYDFIDRVYSGDEDWEEAAGSESFWSGQIELDSELFWIASEHTPQDQPGLFFLVPVEEEA